MIRIPPFSALRAFEAVARHRSVRKAAEELGLDHTVVSRHVRSLQAMLDVPLVRTSRQGVALTPAGDEYAASLNRILADLATATARVDSNRRSANLSIWSVPGFALRWLTPRLPDFHALYPSIEISVRPHESMADLAGFEADAQIIYGEPPSTTLRCTVLARPLVFPVASPYWAATHRNARTPADLVDMPLIHEESHEQWREWFAAHGVTPPDRLRGPRLWHANLALEAAKLGQGVALGNELLCANELAVGDLTEIGHNRVAMHPYLFVARRDRWNEPALVRLRLWIATQMQQEAQTARTASAGR
ncbi:LysR family transcriptional regulator [Rhodovastum atsumiense]|uniref:LysR family transcriptional regulator n=1 Tax=Rhodovastum atsumiense TaxID=504468 RepID=A0A5M6J392_9PROT|nr:LysR substrate-binding domain-containing protein [Rhodovastum atsumiense]KAA5614587.1 LysR family transcriptional regulator [Rhodovastum atsumiense]CAH2599918.1 LysR family transcriptional regulator [Rhodovastum atsumiense]